jgi:hypothetical protein
MVVAGSSASKAETTSFIAYSSRGNPYNGEAKLRIAEGSLRNRGDGRRHVKLHETQKGRNGRFLGGDGSDGFPFHHRPQTMKVG